MDRWDHLDKWKEYERRRARLVPGWVETAILMAVVVSLVGGRLLHCLIAAGPLGACMEAGVPRAWAMSLHSAALLLGIWAGPRIGLQLESKALGWLCGALIVVVASATLVSLNFSIGAG